MLDAPIGAVFDLYSQHERHPEWQPGLLRAELRGEGPVTVGTRGVETRRLFGPQVAFPYVITEHQRPVCSAFRTLAGPVRPEGVARLSESDGRTRMEFTMQLRTQGVLRATEVALRPLFARQTRTDLKRFRAWVQTQLDNGRTAAG